MVYLNVIMTPLGIAADRHEATDPTCLGTKPWIQNSAGRNAILGFEKT